MLEDKIKSFAQIRRIAAALRSKGESIVFTNGCFDILHYGHVKYLQEAKQKGDILVVGVNSDRSVRKLKGPQRPVVGENDRCAVLAALQSVDYVVLFPQETPLELIKSVRPDVLVKGGDWKNKEIVGGPFVSSYGGITSTIKFQEGRSTTGIINKIGQKRTNKASGTHC